MMMMMTMTPDTRVSVSNKVEIVRMGESKNRFIQKLLIPVTLGMCCCVRISVASIRPFAENSENVSLHYHRWAEL